MRALRGMCFNCGILHTLSTSKQRTYALPTPGAPTDETLEIDALVKRHIQRVLEISGGKIHGPGGAGEVLGVNPDRLRYRMKKLGIPFRKQKKNN
jgi:transcriptional regulator with GAF, ATPase, and Fis domain